MQKDEEISFRYLLLELFRYFVDDRVWKHVIENMYPFELFFRTKIHGKSYWTTLKHLKSIFPKSSANIVPLDPKLLPLSLKNNTIHLTLIGNSFTYVQFLNRYR